MKTTRTLINKVKFGTFEVIALLTIPNPDKGGEPITVPMPVNVVAGPNHAYVSVKASNDVYRLTDAKGKRLAQGTPVPYKDDATDAAILRELTSHLGAAAQRGKKRGFDLSQLKVDPLQAIVERVGIAEMLTHIPDFSPGKYTLNKTTNQLTKRPKPIAEPAWWNEMNARMAKAG